MNLKEIRAIIAKPIRTSKGNPTLAVIVKTSKGIVEASAPQGTSKGKHEVREFSVRGINFSINFINAIGKKLKQMDINIDTFDDLKKIEKLIKEVDSSSDWHIMGGNALYALEAALLKATAKFHGYELWQFILGNRKKIIPLMLGNAIGGGLHLEKEKKTDYQEFLIIPKTKHFFDAYFITLQAYKETKKLITKYDKEWQGILTAENAIASTLANSQVLDILDELRKRIREKFDIRLDIGIDMAATSLWKNNGYIYKNFPLRNVMRREEQVNYVFNLIKKYKLFYVEDPFYEDDFLSFSKIMAKLKKAKIKCLICGDDLTTTNPSRIKKAIKEKAINAVIIKPNQVGSLITMRDSIELAKANDITPIISHRSGETFDDTIAHLAVGFQIPYIKTGIIGKERAVKLKELARIERKNGN
jgi:enolase